MTLEFHIGERLIGPGFPPYVIAEVGVNHNGDIGLAKSMIESAAESGADAVKFQTWRTDEFITDKELEYEYLGADGIVRETMYDMFKRLELPFSEHRALRDHCRLQNVEFLSSAADAEAVDLLVDLGVPAIKLASEDLINGPLLDAVAGRNVPVILSTGMADVSEIDEAVARLRQGGCETLMLMHCVSLYPTPDEGANLERIRALARRYPDIAIGYSDHTLGNQAALAAVTLGALAIEKHFTTDRNLPGPDQALSSDPKAFRALVESVRRVAKMSGDGAIDPGASEKEARLTFRRSIVARQAIPADTVITRDMLALKRPAEGLHPRHLDEVIGRRVRTDIDTDAPIQWENLA
jgi:N,N'-diacetyllegionaminate synthase